MPGLGVITRAPAGTLPHARSGGSLEDSLFDVKQLANEIKDIVGPQNVVRLFIPHPSDGPISQDRAKPGVFWTHKTLPDPSRWTKQGRLWALSFDGTQSVSCLDADDLSPGDGTVDRPFSVASLVHPTHKGGASTLMGKLTTSNLEWQISYGATDLFLVSLADQSAAAFPSRSSDAAIPIGAWCLLAGVYSAAHGGGAAASDIRISVNGQDVASTGTEAAGYVAMENLAALGEIGSSTGGTAQFFLGSVAMQLLAASALSAAQLVDLYGLAQRYGAF